MRRLTNTELRLRVAAELEGRDVPPDGLRALRGRAYVDGTGQVVLHIHKRTECAGRPCAIHRPSDHSMRGFRTHFRYDRYLMERICPHNCGHPDPDDVAFQEREMPGRAPSVHGCDGCCSTPEEWARKLEEYDARTGG